MSPRFCFTPFLILWMIFFKKKNSFISAERLSVPSLSLSFVEIFFHIFLKAFNIWFVIRKLSAGKQMKESWTNIFFLIVPLPLWFRLIWFLSHDNLTFSFSLIKTPSQIVCFSQHIYKNNKHPLWDSLYLI